MRGEADCARCPGVYLSVGAATLAHSGGDGTAAYARIQQGLPIGPPLSRAYQASIAGRFIPSRDGAGRTARSGPTTHRRESVRSMALSIRRSTHSAPSELTGARHRFVVGAFTPSTCRSPFPVRHW